MLASLKSLFISPVKRSAHSAYLSIIAASRNPIFYAHWQVPDTLDGRFDIIVLHMFLTLAAYEPKIPPPAGGRLGGGQSCTTEQVSPHPNPPPAGEGELFRRALSELFFADMDRSLREMGVGDTGVGKRVKNMAQAFYGRIKAYESAIGDESLLADALRRNVWRGQPVEESAVALLAAYVHRNRNPVTRIGADTGSCEIHWVPAQPLRVSQDKN